jgi:hypothetical protein
VNNNKSTCKVIENAIRDNENIIGNYMNDILIVSDYVNTSEVNIYQAMALFYYKIFVHLTIRFILVYIRETRTTIGKEIIFGRMKLIE